MPRRGSPYGPAYQRARAALLATHPHCAARLVCDGTPLATEADHVPPIAEHPQPHIEGGCCCSLRPSCRRCARAQGHQLAVRARRRRGRLMPTASGLW